MGNIRLLRAEEIECRTGIVNEKGVSLLLFKDARADQRILDETFTPMGWKRSHQCINGTLYCTVEIWDEGKKQWIAKQDAGSAGEFEREKSQASDSFKRACFNWGIGRELYTAPFIWIPASQTEIIRKGDRFCCYERFSVKRIGYDKGQRICELAITGSDGRMLYELKRPGIDESRMDALNKELARTGVALETVLKRYQLPDLGHMTEEVYRKALRDLKSSKDRKAA